MKKKVIKIVLASVLALVLLIGGTVGGFMIYSANYRVPEPARQVENNTRILCL